MKLTEPWSLVSKTFEKPICNDHILTNHPNGFQHSVLCGKSLAHFHKLTLIGL